ncbi:MAG: PLP-dependent aspartate aminotransferase family protein [Arenicellales bacterium]|nr:PLP-dependent aspartate aminotransferase family protein [Arenicellales bacterium]
MPYRNDHIETRLVHAGEPRIGGAVGMPIFQSSTFVDQGEGSYHDIRYIRLNNTPNHLALNAKLVALENAEAALVAASGMAAISTSILTVLSSGDHMLAQNCLYGGTHDFVTKDLPKLGIDVDFIDAESPGDWNQKLRPNTKAVYVESMTNPLLEVADLEGIVDFARQNNLVSLIDNTFASPVNFRPVERGFDLSLHSCSKYLNGHNDIVAGAVIGRADLVDSIKHKLDHLGGTLDPHTCFLLHRGIKTLAVRMRHQNDSALRVARFLDGHPKVDRVNYPGLESHPAHQRARALFEGFSGMLSFEIRGEGAAKRLLKHLTIPIVAPSLGGVETLITIPALTSHSGLSPQERHQLGITDNLVRLSVGIENAEDLITDFKHALAELP